MTALRKLKEEPTPREVLAQAIADHAESTQKEQEAHAATERARLLVGEARRKHNLAAGAVEEARQERASKLIREASGGDAATHDHFTRQARNKEIEALDELDAAKAALATIEQSAADWAAEAKRRKEWLEKCAEVVLASDHARLLKEAQAVQAELVERRIGLQWLCRFMDSRSAEAKAIDSFLNKDSDQDIPGIVRTSYGWRNHPANETWRAAREALMQSADAPLPVK